MQYIPLDGGSSESGDWSRDAEEANATQAANDPERARGPRPVQLGRNGNITADY